MISLTKKSLKRTKDGYAATIDYGDVTITVPCLGQDPVDIIDSFLFWAKGNELRNNPDIITGNIQVI